MARALLLAIVVACTLGLAHADCASYCTDFVATCPSPYPYLNANTVPTLTTACMATCAGWPAGTANATSGNSLACREYHLGLAATDPDVHCPHASPNGGGVCASVNFTSAEFLGCDSYCDLILGQCSKGVGQLPLGVFDQRFECMNACRMYNKGTFNTSNSPVGNDNLECRMYQGLFAYNAANVAARGFACERASPIGGGNGTLYCSDPCPAYCTIVQDECKGQYSQFASYDACLTTCAGYPVGAKPFVSFTTSGNSFWCRMYHLKLALDDPATHCPHSGPTGGTACTGNTGPQEYDDNSARAAAGASIAFGAAVAAAALLL